MNEQTSQIDDVSAKRTVLVLVIAQAFLGSQMPMLFVVAGLAGQQITPYACLSTLPISLIVFGSMTTAPWLSKIMQLYGRKKGFIIGAFGGFIGAAIGAFALSHNNFWLFLIGSYILSKLKGQDSKAKRIANQTKALDSKIQSQLDAIDRQIDANAEEVRKKIEKMPADQRARVEKIAAMFK